MSKIAFFRSWKKADGASVEAATFAHLKIMLGDRNVTEYDAEDEPRADHLEIPLYYLAEWMAENWWSLLWEPRKSEDSGADGDFLNRHCTLAAQQGYALPRLEFIAAGDEIVVSATSRTVAHADVRFRNGGRTALPRKELESELRKFVTGVVGRLGEREINDTVLQTAWAFVLNTEPDQEDFCRLLGALGVSPYAQNDRITESIERAAEFHDFKALMDLCLAATPGTIEAAVQLVEQAKILTENAPESTLEPLTKTSVPPDNLARPAWMRGVDAAKAVRNTLKIKDNDVQGSSKFFDALKIDLNAGRGMETPDSLTMGSNSVWEDEGQPIVGAIERNEMRSRIALLQRKATQRRFTAARCAFMAWTAEKAHDHRLVTMAVTRDQQASRAFAAEMTAPISYLRMVARTQSLTGDNLYGVANALGVDPDLVRKQAQNNHLLYTR